VDAFERRYGPDGDWARFFALAANDYVGTELLRDRERPGRYLVLDRWRSASAYERFLAQNEDEYVRRGSEAEHLYRTERRLGSYTVAP
jgi:heme-degrading monooxygenase HmoA